VPCVRTSSFSRVHELTKGKNCELMEGGERGGGIAKYWQREKNEGMGGGVGKAREEEEGELGGGWGNGEMLG